MRRLIFLLLLLLPVGASAADELFNNMDDALIYMRQTLGYTTASSNALSDSAGRFFLRSGIVTINPIIRGDKVEWVFTLTYHQNAYAIDSNIIGVLSVEWKKLDSVKSLVYVPRAMWYNMEHQSSKGQRGRLARPSYYDYNEDYLYLYPVPTEKTGAYDTIRVLGYRSVSDLDTVTSLTFMPEAYRVAVVKWAAWQAARARQHPLTESLRLEYLEQIAVINRIFHGMGAPVESDKE